MSCEMFFLELEDLFKENNRKREELRDNDDLDEDEAHEMYHVLEDEWNELEQRDCPLQQQLQALDPTEAKRLVIGSDHDHRGYIEVILNLAHAQPHWKYITTRVVQIIAQEQGWGDVDVVVANFPDGITDILDQEIADVVTEM